MARTWHEQHRSDYSVGQRIADGTAKVLGSWPFIIGQTVFVGVWIVLNILAFARHWDPYPFILLNLMFSVQAAYAAPVIMMSQNRAADRDRYQAQADYETNVKAEQLTEELLERLNGLEARLDRVLACVAATEIETTGEDA